MKRLNLLFMVGITLFTFSFCSTSTDNNADADQAKQTAMLTNQANQEIGLPNITNFQQKKLMKMIYELCDREDLICYAYTKSDYTGKLNYLGKCVGYGIPFAAQYTNPEKLIEGDKYFGYDITGLLNYLFKIPQADPNGLFMPTSSSATWLIMFNPENNEPGVVYFEPEVVVSPFKLPTG